MVEKIEQYYVTVNTGLNKLSCSSLVPILGTLETSPELADKNR